MATNSPARRWRALPRFVGGRITVNQLTQLAWMLALAEALACDDIAIGTTMSERPADIEQVQTLFGLCVASPVLRLRAIRRRPFMSCWMTLRIHKPSGRNTPFPN